MDVFIGPNWDFPGTLPALLLVGPESFVNRLNMEYNNAPLFSILKPDVDFLVVIHRIAVRIYVDYVRNINVDVVTIQFRKSMCVRARLYV